ncbi:MAG: response regulator [Desulfocapsa sp.]|nr:response regulator [Desulfocapsa sp.]
MAKLESSSPQDFWFNQNLIDAIPAPICMQDRKGCFHGANKAFLDFFFLNEKLLTSFDLNSLLNPQIRSKNRELDASILHHGGKQSFEAMVQCSEKIERDVVFHKEAVLGENGEIAGLVTTLEDLTTQRQTEQQLRHSQKMEAIGTLAGGIAHDFNNVLTPIIGYAEIMRLTITRHDTDKNSLLQFVSEILNAGKRAKSLVEQILTFSRSREQKVLPQYLHPMIKEVLKLIRVTLPTNIKISQEIDEDCGLVMIDPVQFHQMLLNLCTNSAQSMGDSQGELVISLSKSDKDKQGKEWIVLSVADTGQGIPSGLRRRVFEPYFTTREKEQGTGMGLAMVHGIVARCGGYIELQSEEGQGTVFQLYFPRIVLEKDAITGRQTNGVLGGTERVIVVDDQDAVLKVTKKILTTLGYRVSVCSSSSEALKLFSWNPGAFDLIITDYAMPVFSGLELCAEVKKQRENIPIILSTGYGEKFSDKELRDVGFSAWLTKPVALQKLAMTVRGVLDHH